MGLDNTLFANELQKLVKAPVLQDAPLKRYTTWRIGGPADLLISPESRDELAAVMSYLASHEIPWMVMGNGSNLLVGDKGFRGAVIRMGEAFSGMRWQDDRVFVSAGTLLPVLAQEAGERSLTGLEFARGIPGSMGGAVRMNAGAYGSNIGPLVTSIEGVAYNGELIRMEKTELSFAYRTSSLFQVDAIVTGVELQLAAGDREESLRTMRELMARRSEVQPLEYPSCGSVFRNPEGDHAGYLVERAGLRGTRIGGLQVSEKHGNFMVNRWDATAEDARQLIAFVQEKIYEFAGVRLEPEVRFVGEF